MLGYAAKGRGYETGYAGQTADCASGGNSGGLAQGADGQLKLNFEEGEEKKHTKLDFGRTGDRIYIDAKQSVTLMGRQRRGTIFFLYTRLSGMYWEGKRGAAAIRREWGRIFPRR